jgi:hypothetical protein
VDRRLVDLPHALDGLADRRLRAASLDDDTDRLVVVERFFQRLLEGVERVTNGLGRKCQVRNGEDQRREATAFGAEADVVLVDFGLETRRERDREPKVDEDDVSFSAEGGGFASLIFAISDLAYSPKSVRYSFDTFEQALKKPLDDDQTVSVVVKAGSAQTPVGKAVERVWQVDETPIHGRLLLVPICGGTGMLVIGQGYSSEATRALLDSVVAGVRKLAAGSPICAELDP